MKRNTFVVLVVGLAMLGLAAACGGDDATATPVPPVPGATAAPTATTGPQPTTVVGDQPKSGGTFLLGWRRDTRHTDPHASGGGSESKFRLLMYNRLLQRDLDDEATILPELAESWTISGDGKVYTFRLRSDVKFHNVEPMFGRTLNAEDVAWNMNRFWSVSRSTNPLKPPPPTDEDGRAFYSVPAYFEFVESIEVLDGLTVRVTLSRADALFLSQISVNRNLTIVDPVARQLWGPRNNKDTGSGPFLQGKQVTGVSISFEKNPDYFEEGRPYVDLWEAIIIPDATARKAAFRSEQIHWISRVTLSDVEDLRRTDPDIIAQRSLDGCEFLTINPIKKPLDDIRVRQAINLAIDREEIIQLVALGDGDPCGVFQPGLAYALPLDEVAQLPGLGQQKDDDIAEAKRLMAEAGFPDGGLELEISAIALVTFLVPIMEVIATQLDEIGIDLTVTPMDQSVFQNHVLRGDPGTAKFDLAINPGGLQDTNPARHTSNFTTTSRATAYKGAGSPELDALILEARFEPDETRAAALYRQIQEQVFAEVHQNIPIFAAFTYNVMQPYVKGIKTGTASIVTFTYGGWRWAWIDR